MLPVGKLVHLPPGALLEAMVVTALRTMPALLYTAVELGIIQGAENCPLSVPSGTGVAH